MSATLNVSPPGLEVLFVHGMGRTPLSGWPMLRKLQGAGHRTHTFTYFVALEEFDAIARRLAVTLEDTARLGDYVVVGHSLGGVLLRAALSHLDPSVGRPLGLFLLGSPVRRASLASRLAANPVFRLLAGDCGQLLASETRMNALGQAGSTRSIGVAGVVGGASRFGPLGKVPNDGLVALSEVSADWLSERIEVAVPHTWLPASPAVARLIADRIVTLRS